VKVYVVTGSFGDYSDREVWLVAAYLDKTLAEKHVNLADAESRDKAMPFRVGASNRYAAIKGSPLDNKMQVRAGEYTTYAYEVVELRDTLPTVKP